MLLAIYKEITDKLGLIDAATNKFYFGSDERSRLFSGQNDLRFKFYTF